MCSYFSIFNAFYCDTLLGMESILCFMSKALGTTTQFWDKKFESFYAKEQRNSDVLESTHCTGTSLMCLHIRQLGHKQGRVALRL